jgi:hypothetical protein
LLALRSSEHKLTNQKGSAQGSAQGSVQGTAQRGAQRTAQRTAQRGAQRGAQAKESAKRSAHGRAQGRAHGRAHGRAKGSAHRRAQGRAPVRETNRPKPPEEPASPTQQSAPCSTTGEITKACRHRSEEKQNTGSACRSAPLHGRKPLPRQNTEAELTSSMRMTISMGHCAFDFKRLNHRNSLNGSVTTSPYSNSCPGLRTS